jgi:hypothetical protein
MHYFETYQIVHGKSGVNSVSPPFVSPAAKRPGSQLVQSVLAVSSAYFPVSQLVQGLSSLLLFSDFKPTTLLYFPFSHPSHISMPNPSIAKKVPAGQLFSSYLHSDAPGMLAVGNGQVLHGDTNCSDVFWYMPDGHLYTSLFAVVAEFEHMLFAALQNSPLRHSFPPH